MRLTFIALALLLVLSACGERQTGTDQDAPLRGRTFLATAVTDGGAPRTLVAGTELSLEFTADSRLVARAGCNTMEGRVDTAEGKLAIDGGLVQTDMACDEVRLAQDNFVADVLSASPGWRLAGDDLTITSGDAELVLAPRESVHPDRALAGTTWVLDTMTDGQVASSVPATVPEVTVVFDGKRVVAETHCNGAGGEYTVSNDRIMFEPPEARTLKLCSPEIMAVETAVQESLGSDPSYEITADRLTITDASGRGIQLHAK